MPTARRRCATSLASALLAALALHGCTACSWSSYIPKEKPPPLPATAPRALEMITLGERHTGVLDCMGTNDCNHWYRVQVPRSGELQIDVQTEPFEDRPMMRVLVRELGYTPLAQTMGGEDGRLRIRATATRGVYLILVQGGGGRTPYALTVNLELPPEPYDDDSTSSKHR